MRATVSPVVVALSLVLPPTLAADFDDGDYHEVVLFNWDSTALDVFILPPAAPDPLARLDAVELGIAAWDSGVDDLAASWLATGLVIDTYAPGDVPPVAAVRDPEIVVLTGEVNPVLLAGIGISTDDLVCGFLPFGAADVRTVNGLRPEAFHRHDGSAWAVAQCRTSTDNVCFVVNTNFALSEIVQDRSGQYWMYDLNAHEFGHCLGIGHVGDALDFEAREYPREDIMSYQDDPDQVHCVSTLNVRALEGAFAKVFGRPSSEWLDPGDYVHMAPSSYDQVVCANP